MDRKVGIVTAILLWLLAVACGSTGGGATPGAAAPPAATVAPAKVGDRVEQGGIALTVTKTEKKDALSDFQKAKEGMVFLIAEVLIENIGDKKEPYNLLYFKLRDSEGFEYTPALGVDQPMQSGELDPGGKARGNVAFEVKTDGKGLTLEYKPIVIGSSDAIKVVLE